MPRKNFKVDLKMETLYTFDVKAVDIHEAKRLTEQWWMIFFKGEAVKADLSKITVRDYEIGEIMEQRYL